MGEDVCPHRKHNKYLEQFPRNGLEVFSPLFVREQKFSTTFGLQLH